MTKTIWVDTTGASTTYVPREKPIQESVAPFSGTISGAAPATTNLGTNSGQRILAADGTWIPQPAFTSGGADQLETLRPSVISTSYSANPPTVTDSAKAYDVDTNHATTFGQWYAAQEARINNRVDIFSLTTWASKTQTWTAATINVSRSYAILQDGESASVDGLSSKTSSVKYEFSTNNGSSWTTLGTDTQSSIPTAPQTLSMALGSLTPTMGNILVKVTITRGGGGTIYEDGVSLPGLTGEVDLKLFDVWIDGTYAGGAGNITCNNLTVTGDATFQNKIYDSTASAGTTGQVLKVAANGKVTWATDSAGTGTVTSITTTGANGVTISGGSTQTITTSGTFALALGNITPTSISTGTGSFSGDVEFAASIKSPNGSNSPVTIVPDGTGDLHVNADSLRLGDNNANATIATNGTGDLILTTHEGSATEGVIRLYDGANGNITLTPNGTGQVQVGSDQVVTLIASQTLTNKTLSSNSVWNGNTIGVAYGGTGLTTLTAGYIPYGNGTSAFGSSANLFWDSANSRLGVGTASPYNKVEIEGASARLGLNNGGGASRKALLIEPLGYGGNTYARLESYDYGTSTGGILALNVTGGNVGIGTASPSTKLHVSNAGVNAQATFVGTTGAPYITVVGNSGTTILGNESNGGWVGTVGSQSFVFKTTDIERVRIDSSGNIGIGTSSPASRLMISGTGTGAWFTVNRTDSGTNIIDFTASGSRLGYVGYNGSDLYLNQASAANTIFFTNNTERMRITSGGLVGIGVSSPSSNLSISSSSDTGIRIKGGSSALSYIDFDEADSGTPNGSIAYVHASNYMTFATGGSNAERMRIDSSGNLGIGTSSPSTKLHVANGGSNAQATFVGTTGSPYITVVANSGTTILGNESNGGWVGTTGSQAFVFKTNDTERMRITSGGSLLLGGTAVPSESAWFGTAVFGKTGTDKVITGYLGSSTNGATIGGHNSALNAWSSLNINATDVIFRSNETETARLTSSGNLGVGNTSPSERLTVTGKIKASDVLLGNNGTKGYGAITTTTSTSTPTGGSSGDHYYIY